MLGFGSLSQVPSLSTVKLISRSPRRCCYLRPVGDSRARALDDGACTPPLVDPTRARVRALSQTVEVITRVGERLSTSTPWIRLAIDMSSTRPRLGRDGHWPRLAFSSLGFTTDTLLGIGLPLCSNEIKSSGTPSLCQRITIVVGPNVFSLDRRASVNQLGPPTSKVTLRGPGHHSSEPFQVILPPNGHSVTPVSGRSIGLLKPRSSLHSNGLPMMIVLRGLCYVATHTGVAE